MTVSGQEKDTADALFINEGEDFFAFLPDTPPGVLATLVCCLGPEGAGGDDLEGGGGGLEALKEPLLLHGAEHGAFLEVSIVATVCHEEVDVTVGELEPATGIVRSIAKSGIGPVFLENLPHGYLPVGLERIESTGAVIFPEVMVVPDCVDCGGSS